MMTTMAMLNLWVLLSMEDVRLTRNQMKHNRRNVFSRESMASVQIVDQMPIMTLRVIPVDWLCQIAVNGIMKLASASIASRAMEIRHSKMHLSKAAAHHSRKLRQKMRFSV